MNTKLTSLSIFFPFYNDEGTVERQIENAYSTGRKASDDLEVIAVHGGNSKDGTFGKILEMKQKYPKLRIVDKKDNTEGYAVIKYGLAACNKDWIFYTDGDAQYHIEEDLPLLVATALETGADVINGYKKVRRDDFLRVFLGGAYAFLARKDSRMPIRDIDCDFRLIRKKILDKISLDSGDASILPEMVKKLELAGAKFAEVPVNHYEREYGLSNYTVRGLFKEKLVGDAKLFLRMLSRNPRIFIFLRKVLELNFTGEKKVLSDNFVCEPEDTVLDLGCGTGEFSVFFNPNKYVGIDIEENYIAYAKKHYKGTFVSGDATKLPFEDGFFSKITILGVLHHLDDNTSNRVLSEAKRVLATNGQILVMEDVNRREDGSITRLLHKLDNGSYIRNKEGYEKLLVPYFKIKSNFFIKSGLCPYQVFIMEKHGE